MNFDPRTMLVGATLLLLQLLLAIPWVWCLLLSREQAAHLKLRMAEVPFGRRLLLTILVLAGAFVVAGLVGPAILMSSGSTREQLEAVGRYYTALLQVQITLDLFLLAFWLLLRLWPKGGAVAMAAFFEGVRQPMFWLLFGLASFLMVVWIVVPYFTFGEDYLVVKQLGYDTIMLAGIIFGCLGASLSISEEIEGRSAITVMSKPVSRRQFMLGKFVGILLGCLFLFGLLSVVFQEVLIIKHWWDRLETLDSPEFKDKLSRSAASMVGVVPIWPFLKDMISGSGLPDQVQHLLGGIAQWLSHAADILPTLVLCFSQVMVLVALAVALSTRLPVVVNVVAVVAVFFLSHLTPVLLGIARKTSEEQAGAAVGRILGFVAQVFDTLLPDLGAFSMDPALLSESPPAMDQFLRYVASVSLYGLVYTGIVLLFGLILFEDRDLA